MRAVLSPTPEQLQAAWQRRKRGTWPPTFDAAMADPLYSRLVHMTALQQLLLEARTARRAQHMAGQQADLQASAQPGQHRQPWPARRPAATTGSMPTQPDRKRLAAGDTDDDD